MVGTLLPNKLPLFASPSCHLDGVKSERSGALKPSSDVGTEDLDILTTHKTLSMVIEAQNGTGECRHKYIAANGNWIQLPTTHTRSISLPTHFRTYVSVLYALFPIASAGCVVI